jgi:DNA-binding HxlR family transcriptional regulator
LRDLMERPMRFNELKRSLDGITSKVLSERLKELRVAEVIDREIFPEVPVRVVYTLTEKGRDLGRVIDDIRAWGNRWMPLDAQA